MVAAVLAVVVAAVVAAEGGTTMVAAAAARVLPGLALRNGLHLGSSSGVRLALAPLAQASSVDGLLFRSSRRIPPLFSLAP